MSTNPTTKATTLSPLPGLATAAAASEDPAPVLCAGSKLKRGQFVELAGVAIYEVTKLPELIERKDKEPVEIPGSASLVRGNCTQRIVELWPTRNYYVVQYKPASSEVRNPTVQKGATTTETMTTAQPQR